MASSGWPTCVALLVMVVLLNASRMSEGTLILVGDDKGWTDKGVDYVAWAAAHKVHVGDSVVFVNKDIILHTIDVLGSKEAYDNCTLGGGTIIPINPGKNYTIPIPSALLGQTFYVACSISGHCAKGQKLQGTVLPAETAPTPASPPTMTPGSPQTPSPVSTSDADLNRFICWTTAVLLIGACFLSAV